MPLCTNNLGKFHFCSNFVPAKLCLDWTTGPEVIKLFPCSTQLSTKFILLINVKMPTIVGILTFISMINTTSERLKVRYFFICRYFSFMSSWNFVLGWVEHEKSFITSGPGLRPVSYWLVRPYMSSIAGFDRIHLPCGPLLYHLRNAGGPMGARFICLLNLWKQVH